MTWSTAFDDPIPLPDGGTLRTLREAGEYIARLPKTLQGKPEWQTAAEVLLLVAEADGPTMIARIGIMRALNAGKPDPRLGPGRKRARAYRIIR